MKKSICRLTGGRLVVHLIFQLTSNLGFQLIQLIIGRIEYFITVSARVSYHLKVATL
jgi:hypothetical protein